MSSLTNGGLYDDSTKLKTCFSLDIYIETLSAKSCPQNLTNFYLGGRNSTAIMSSIFMRLHECFYNFSKVCLQFFSFLNVVFFRLFYDNITFQHLFFIIKCPAELNFDCKILIRSVPSTFVTELLLRGYVFLTFPKPTPSCMRSETNNNALSNLSYNGY